MVLEPLHYRTTSSDLATKLFKKGFTDVENEVVDGNAVFHFTVPGPLRFNFEKVVKRYYGW